MRRYVNTLDYSLDQIKLREVYERVYGRRDFTFEIGHKEYTHRVINVTFKYAVAEWNKAGKDRYVKAGFNERDLVFRDCIARVNGEVVGIQLNLPPTTPVIIEELGPYFGLGDKGYTLIKQPRKTTITSGLRRQIYEQGFLCGGIKYVRWKRSSGSSRVGKCLFIDENLYSRMHRWEMCGLKVRDGQEIDLAALESYISLPSSSIIDLLEIQPENILVIDDYKSVFKDKVVSVSEKDGAMDAKLAECEIENSIWDGQGLIDPSILGSYADKGMVLLRNLFFKCCCFNCNIRQFFAEHHITDVGQLHGHTTAASLDDIKLITTPSSIKYLKFGTLDEWLRNVGTTFGIVKYDKKTHFFDGRMVQTHYQLLNTLQMSRAETKALLADTFAYMTLLKRDPAAMRYHIKYPIEQELEITPARSKNDIVYKMLGINDRFAETRLYYDFKVDLMKAFTKNLKLGHVLVEGNYSTLLGNPMEMLYAAIGQFDGQSILGVGHVHSLRFPFGKRLLGSRSPHISMSNVWLCDNVEDGQIDRYFNLSPEILCVNSIGENVLNKLSGCDFDSDTVMLTDNAILISAAERNNGRFPVAISQISAKKTKRQYTASQKADLDIKTSNNLIGDIVNLSQELNTMIWDRLNRGGKLEDVWDIYLDVCKLNVGSGIEIRQSLGARRRA